MPNRFAVGHRDLNEPLITAVLSRAGIEYILLREGDGADILVKDNPMYFVEVKNDSQPPSKRKLTDDEIRLQAECERNGIEFYVVLTPEQMAEIVNERRR